MNESKQIETLTALAEEHERTYAIRPTVASVRVSPGPYLAAASVLTFVSALLLRTEQDFWSLTVVVSAWIGLPLLALTDRIVFDGRRIVRRGPVVSLIKSLSPSEQYLAIDDFETVETNAIR